MVFCKMEIGSSEYYRNRKRYATWKCILKWSRRWCTEYVLCMLLIFSFVPLLRVPSQAPPRRCFRWSKAHWGPLRRLLVHLEMLLEASPAGLSGLAYTGTICPRRWAGSRIGLDVWWLQGKNNHEPSSQPDQLLAGWASPPLAACSLASRRRCWLS